MARDESTGQLPEATVGRLPVYLQVLTTAAGRGVHNISSEGLADLAGVNAAKVRKDLSYLGSYGTRGVGYPVEHLIEQIRHELGLNQEWPVLIVGAGNLGQALAGYGGFDNRGFRVVAIADVDSDKVGSCVGGLTIQPIERLANIVDELEVAIGIIATPPDAAAEAAASLVNAGVRSILNFAPVVLSVPAHVGVRNVDLAIELQILSYHDLHRHDLHRHDLHRHDLHRHDLHRHDLNHDDPGQNDPGQDDLGHDDLGQNHLGQTAENRPSLIDSRPIGIDTAVSAPHSDIGSDTAQIGFQALG